MIYRGFISGRIRLMIIKYLSCDGETEIEEEITRAEIFQNMSHNYFLRCARPDGDTFEIYHIRQIIAISD